MSVERTLRYSSTPGEPITLKDLRIFLGDAALVGFGEGVLPYVTLQNSGGPSKAGTIQHVVIEDVLD
jgi:hypothetical protein